MNDQLDGLIVGAYEATRILCNMDTTAGGNTLRLWKPHNILAQLETCDGVSV